MKRPWVPAGLAILVASGLLVAPGVAYGQAANVPTPGEAVKAISEGLKRAVDETDKTRASGLVNDARSEYEKSLQADVRRQAAARDARVSKALDAARGAALKGDSAEVAVQRQIVEKSLLAAAHDATAASLDGGNAAEAARWFTVLSWKFKYGEKPSDASRAMDEIGKDPSKANTLKETVKADLRAVFFGKVREETQEAVIFAGKGDGGKTRELIEELDLYFAVIRPDVARVLGESRAKAVETEIEEARGFAAQGNLAKVKGEIEEVDIFLEGYSPTPAAGAPSAPTATPAAGPGAPPADAAGIQSVISTLKLVAQEYKDAVKGGKVIDAGEYDEAKVFSDAAASRYAPVQSYVRSREAATDARVAANIESVKRKIEAKAEPAEVDSLLQETIRLLQALAGGSATTVAKGAVDAMQIADGELPGEFVVGDYRVGLIAESSEPIWSWEGGRLVEKREGTHHLEVVLRERATKRPLPHSNVTLTLKDPAGSVVAAKQLLFLWGAFEHYGENFLIPADGTYAVEVGVSPPLLSRHADASTVHLGSATVDFTLQVRGGKAAVSGAPAVTPLPAGAEAGSDVTTAHAEAIGVKEAGDYRVGFIAESPEEVWAWEGGRLARVPADPLATKHLEVVLFEKSTGRFVPYSAVHATFANTKTKEKINVSLAPVWSKFFHYQANAAIPPGTYDVDVTASPPSFSRHEDGGRLAGPATVRFASWSAGAGGGEGPKESARAAVGQLIKELEVVSAAYGRGDGAAAQKALDVYAASWAKNRDSLHAISKDVAKEVEELDLFLDSLKSKMRRSADAAEVSRQVTIMKGEYDEIREFIGPAPASPGASAASPAPRQSPGFGAVMAAGTLAAALAIYCRRKV